MDMHFLGPYITAQWLKANGGEYCGVLETAQHEDVFIPGVGKLVTRFVLTFEDGMKRVANKTNSLALAEEFARVGCMAEPETWVGAALRCYVAPINKKNPKPGSDQTDIEVVRHPAGCPCDKCAPKSAVTAVTREDWPAEGGAFEEFEEFAGPQTLKP